MSSINAARIIASTGVKLPTFTSGTRPGSPDVGLLIFNSTTLSVECWDGTSWFTVGGGFNQTFTNVSSFNYTGSDQTFVVPTGVTVLQVKLWGAGGGGGNRNSNYTGGGGGYTTGFLNVLPGQTYTLIVGQGGVGHTGRPLNNNYRYGGGASGGSGGGYDFNFASGGGRSAIRSSTGTELATAGAGGGAGYGARGGGAGGAVGESGGTGETSGSAGGGGITDSSGAGPTGSGGSTGTNGSEVGSPGIQFAGGYSGGTAQSEGGGGGGGYYGGGGGGDNTGGGGGSGYFGGLSTSGVSSTLVNYARQTYGTTGQGMASVGQADIDYAPGIGVGAPGGQTAVVAGHGRIVIRY